MAPTTGGWEMANTNLPELSKRALLALEVLGDGGEFRHGLERNTFTGREQFTYRLRNFAGVIVRGVGLRAFHELSGNGFLRAAHSTSSATYYKLNA